MDAWAPPASANECSSWSFCNSAVHLRHEGSCICTYVHIKVTEGAEFGNHVVQAPAQRRVSDSRLLRATQVGFECLQRVRLHDLTTTSCGGRAALALMQCTWLLQSFAPTGMVKAMPLPLCCSPVRGNSFPGVDTLLAYIHNIHMQILTHRATKVIRSLHAFEISHDLRDLCRCGTCV